MHPRSLSLWHDTLPPDDDLVPRPSLPGDQQVDVAIIGAGYTGLWTAHALARRCPDARIVVLESEFAGFGASGRNGGWCSALLPMSLSSIAAAHGHDAAVRMQRAMHDTVDEVGRVAALEGIDCHFAKGGTVDLARNPAHVDRLQAAVAEARRYALGEDDLRWLSADDARAAVGATDVLGGTFTPHCAAIHPARLARGLARVVEAAGVRVYERTRVRAIEPRRVVTDRGVVRCDHVVRATEGFTPSLAGHRRRIVPIYSLMIATEPLPAEVWDEVGLRRRETFADARRLVIYGQRTADDRLAFGGRGAPYHFGSAIDPAFDRDAATHEAIHRTLVELFPSMAGARVTHRWGGPVGVPRDWTCSVGLDRATGIAWAGGYVGDGVATTNLAGRTLCDLIAGDRTDLVDLPWVNHRSRSWEPEPLRWIGINAMVRLPKGIDAHEARHRRRERWRSWVLDSVLGH